MELSARLTTESRTATRLRRALAIPGLLVVWLGAVLTLPVALAAALLHDIVRRRPFPAVRFYLAVVVALSAHVLCLILLVRARLVGRARERTLDLRDEVWLATTLWRAATGLYGMRLVVEGEDVLEGDGPLVIMARHTSLLDILLLLVSVSGGHGFHLRYVAKRQLLWDPCVDLMGHRIATAFVRRGGREHGIDVAAVESLADELGPRDAVVIFPEGTRFSPEKQERALATLAARDPEAFARAARLQHVLPPHVAGPLGVLEHARGADVVFCAHTGLEGASHLRDLLAGSLLGRTVRVRYWRVAAADVPADKPGRIEWLGIWWERIDRWIGDQTPSARVLLRSRE